MSAYEFGVNGLKNDTVELGMSEYANNLNLFDRLNCLSWDLDQKWVQAWKPDIDMDCWEVPVFIIY